MKKTLIIIIVSVFFLIGCSATKPTSPTHVTVMEPQNCFENSEVTSVVLDTFYMSSVEKRELKIWCSFPPGTPCKDIKVDRLIKIEHEASKFYDCKLLGDLFDYEP